MTYDNFTVNSQEAILAAQRIAGSLDQMEVGTCHLLNGIIDTDSKLTQFLFEKAGISQPMLKREVFKMIEKYTYDKGATKQYLSKDSNKALSTAKKLMKEWGDEFISLELMLLGIMRGKDDVAKLLKNFGATEEIISDGIKELRKGKKVKDQTTDKEYQALQKYAINLNDRAHNGELDPIVGRDEEMRRIMHIISRRQKNNPILVGDSGVGKTAIVEGIAWRIINGDVPENLKGKQLHMLDLASMVAGAKYKGEFEERIKAVIKEVKNSDGEILLFVDEIHSMVGAGGGNGGMDAANILKPALARGELLIIGATTPAEYQKYFEKDKALVRRFQVVNIDEPSVEDTISILRGIQERYEVYHKIEIKDEALVAAAELSHRYVTERKLPDKAIDLIDEAASKLRLELDSMPEELDALQRNVQKLEIEKQYLKKEKNTKELKKVVEELGNEQEKLDSITAAWKIEKGLIDQIVELKEKEEKLNSKADKLEREAKYEEVAEIRHGKLKEIEAGLIEAQKKLDAIDPEERLTNEEVNEEDIAETISRWTGVPVTKMQQSDRARLLDLEAEIAKRLVGQKEAVVAVCNAVRRSRSGLQDAKKPVGSFLFLGPTGVGKTELAKALAETLFDDENAITRIDMSEYQEKHSVSRLIGPPPGYVGYEEGGQLTEAVRRRAYSIILLDEIEKAHPDTFNILLQVLDDGRLTDNKGRVANFKNTIIIMTSNMGAEIILENFEDLEAVGDEHRQDIIDTTKEELFDNLKENLRPEFLNRIDEKIMFLPLTKEEIKIIAGFMLKKVKKNLAKQDIGIKFTDSAMDLLSEQGYDPQFGARPLNRVIQKNIVNALAIDLLSGNYVAGDTIYVGTDKKGYTFSSTPPKEEQSPIKEVAKKKQEKKKKDKVAELEKATKDLEKAVKDVKEDTSKSGK